MIEINTLYRFVKATKYCGTAFAIDSTFTTDDDGDYVYASENGVDSVIGCDVLGTWLEDGRIEDAKSFKPLPNTPYYFLLAGDNGLVVSSTVVPTVVNSQYKNRVNAGNVFMTNELALACAHAMNKILRNSDKRPM